MTISDARQALFVWYDKNDSFCLERDYSKLILIHDGEDDEKKACVLGALKNFEEATLISKSEYGETEYYFLIKPFATLEQNVTLNAQTATLVSSNINQFCELINDNRDFCDPTEINEKDIYNLINIIGFYRGDYSDKENSS